MLLPSHFGEQIDAERHADANYLLDVASSDTSLQFPNKARRAVAGVGQLHLGESEMLPSLSYDDSQVFGVAELSAGISWFKRDEGVHGIPFDSSSHLG